MIRNKKDLKNNKSVTVMTKRKFQISNGHYLNTGHLARIINIIRSDKEKNYTLYELVEETGLPLRQVRNRISIGRALGLFENRSFRLTALGELISFYDLFLDSRATLEYLHYIASGNYFNLIWYEVFNTVLETYPITNYTGWVKYFQSSLQGQYTDKSLKDHLSKELRFIIDTYVENSFKKLGILQKDYSGNLFRVRYTGFHPLIFSAMIYNYCEREKTNLYQIEDMFNAPGSPSRVFGLDLVQLRRQIGLLHDQGLLRYETTHSLDQIRLKNGFCSMEFLLAYYEKRPPLENHKTKQESFLDE